MTRRANTHEASGSATGYLFQCRYALLAGLQAIARSPQLEISIEKLDDVGFEADGEPTQLIQTKHHIDKQGSLTDASVDLWKTLNIWAKRVAEEPEAPFKIKFVLLTTGFAPERSAASLLRTRDRNEEAADQLLLQTAVSSKNKENAAAYETYRALPEDLRQSMLKAILVLDGSPNIIDVGEEIAHELIHAAPRAQVHHLVERLEGWWFASVIRVLCGVGPSAIPVLAIDQRVDELREEFRRDALPVDFASISPPAAVVAELDKRPFVTQLRKIKIGPRRVEYAIRDFYRASEQRSRWAREELLVGGELENYERQLVEAWEPRYAAMVDALEPGCPSDKKTAAGQQLYSWVENDAHFTLRSVRDRFLTQGSYHILSNRYVVGWHPEYRDDSPDEGEG